MYALLRANRAAVSLQNVAERVETLQHVLISAPSEEEASMQVCRSNVAKTLEAAASFWTRYALLDATCSAVCVGTPGDGGAGFGNVREGLLSIAHPYCRQQDRKQHLQRHGMSDGSP